MMIRSSLRQWAIVPACVLLAGIAAAQPAHAGPQQGVTVSGQVTNTLSRAPVANATVTLDEIPRSVNTDKDGRFMFDGVPPGTYHLTVKSDGFLARRSEIRVASSPVTSDAGLDPELHFTEVVSVSPDARNQFDSYQPTTVLGGQERDKELEPTIGETLQFQPGIAVRSFGPGPSRPVVRGLDGDRVLILEDGQRSGDLSSQSGDHGVNTNPASARRIEVVRGPATLLYGANAIGGLVNAITNDIPDEPVTGASGAFTFDAGSAAKGAGVAGDVTVGNGRVALHLGGSGRRSGEYSTPDGEIPNSFNRSGLGQVGVSWTGQNGFFGAGFGYDKSHYGIPLVEEGETNLDPRRHMFNVRGERRNMTGFLNAVRASVGVRRYRHSELDGDAIVTAFENDTVEFDLSANHRGGQKLKGSFGVWALGRSFATAGEESLSPPVDQRSFAGFFYEEITASPHVSFQFGGRVEHTSFTPEVDEPARDFTNFSGSVGLLVHPTDRTSLAVSVARASRNPALEELYYHGAHPGNFAIENGDPDLESEHALGFDVSLRWRGSRASGEVTYFFNNIRNFIFRELTGEIEDEFPVTFFAAGDSRLQGLESHLDVGLAPYVFLEGGLDYVHGELTSSGDPLPRMPPLRGRVGLRVQRNAWQAGGEGIFSAKQDRVFNVRAGGEDVGETETDGYGLLKLYTSYSFARGRTTSTITARLDNATNALYRNHLNYLKDLVPEIGRNFRLVYAVRF